MNLRKARILKALAKNATPYADIHSLADSWDIYDPQFVAAFQSLVEHGYIASRQSEHCGLTIGIDGAVKWVSSDIYLTEFGQNILSN